MESIDYAERIQRAILPKLHAGLGLPEGRLLRDMAAAGHRGWRYVLVAGRMANAPSS